MQTKFAFTDTRIAALPAQAKRYAVQDEKNPGLYCRVTETGARAFYLSVWHDGKRRWVRLGASPAMSVKQAVAEYRARRSSIGANGTVAQAETIKRMTLSEVWDEYLALNPDQQCAETIVSRRYYFNKHLRPTLGGRFLHEVRPRDVDQFKSRMVAAGSGRNANEGLIMLRLLYRWAIKVEILPEGYVGPADTIRQAKVNPPRSRRLHSEEFRAFLAAVEEYGTLKHPDLSPGYHTTVADALKVMLFTGARSANVKQMRWQDINLDRGVWVVPAGMAKTRREYNIALTSQVTEILRRRHAGPAGLGDYVFPGKGDAPYLGAMRKSWQTILDLAGLEGLTVHDLRRTQASVQADLGVNLAHIGEALCHTDIASTMVYTHASGLEALRANTERANRAMTGAASDPAGLELTVDEWQEIVTALGASPLAHKVRAMADVMQVA